MQLNFGLLVKHAALDDKKLLKPSCKHNNIVSIFIIILYDVALPDKNGIMSLKFG